MNKKIVLIFVACLLFMAACARSINKEEARNRIMMKRHDQILRHVRRHEDNVPKVKTEEVNKKVMHHDMKRHERKVKIMNHIREHHMTTLVSDTLTEKNINWGELFSIDVPKGESLAVQVVRSSNLYRADDGRYPTLTLCRPEARSCVSDGNGQTLSFEVDAATLEKARMKSGTYDFTISTGRSSITGVAVGIYACVGKNASLETCRTKATVYCLHGKPSDVMNVCVCDEGYTGKQCYKTADTAPRVWDMDSDFVDAEDIIAMIFCIVFNLLFFAFFILTFCCICVRCCRAVRRGRTVANRPTAAPVAPVRPVMAVPPAYYAGGYHPLSVVPPPPPPPPAPMPRVQYVTQPQYVPRPMYVPQPQPQYVVRPQPQPQPQPQRQPQTHRYNPYEDVELNTLPARNPNPTFVMPPLAPVKQVPVFVRPPAAPKN